MDPTKCFKLWSIKLWEAHFTRDPRVESVKFPEAETEGQSFRRSSHEVVKFDTNEGIEHEVLRCLVHVGVRLVDKTEEAEDAADAMALFTIEARFCADFKIVCADYNDEELQDFVQFNSVHVVWPFWREHVYSTLRGASLPLLEVPLFPGRPKPTKSIDSKATKKATQISRT